MGDGPTPTELPGTQQTTEIQVNTDQETADAVAYVQYLAENHLALLVRGSTGRFIEEHQKEGALPKGVNGYSYWTVFSPDLNPELLDPGYGPKLKKMISKMLWKASSYKRQEDQALVLTTLLPVDQLTQSPEQQGYQFERGALRFKKWGSGRSSLNIDRGMTVGDESTVASLKAYLGDRPFDISNFILGIQELPGFRTNEVIPANKLGIFYGDSIHGAPSQVIHMKES